MVTGILRRLGSGDWARVDDAKEAIRARIKKVSASKIRMRDVVILFPPQVRRIAGPESAKQAVGAWVRFVDCCDVEKRRKIASRRSLHYGRDDRRRVRRKKKQTTSLRGSFDSTDSAQ